MQQILGLEFVINAKFLLSSF